MKKKILIVLLIIIVIALVGVGYFVFTDMMQEDKLKTELSELNDLVNAENINMDAVNEKLDRRITTGDYEKVEDAYKSYLRDNFDNSIQIANILNDEKIEEILNNLSTNFSSGAYSQTITDFVALLKDSQNSYLLGIRYGFLICLVLVLIGFFVSLNIKTTLESKVAS